LVNPLSDTDLHNAFFGNGGKFGPFFPTREEREAFAKTPEYEEIVRMLAVLQCFKVRSVLSVGENVRTKNDLARNIEQKKNAQKNRQAKPRRALVPTS